MNGFDKKSLPFQGLQSRESYIQHLYPPALASGLPRTVLRRVSDDKPSKGEKNGSKLPSRGRFSRRTNRPTPAQLLIT